MQKYFWIFLILQDRLGLDLPKRVQHSIWWLRQTFAWDDLSVYLPRAHHRPMFMLLSVSCQPPFAFITDVVFPYLCICIYLKYYGYGAETSVGCYVILGLIKINVKDSFRVCTFGSSSIGSFTLKLYVSVESLNEIPILLTVFVLFISILL